MKRTLLTGLEILILNILLSCCALFAAYIMLTRDDLVMGILFALLVVAGIVLQPWSLFLLLLIIPAISIRSPLALMAMLISAPLILTIFTTWFYLVFEKNRKTYKPLLRFLTMPLGMKLEICAISVLLLVGIAYSRMIDFPALNTKPPLQLQSDAALGSFKHSRTYRISSEIFSTNWYWRAVATPQQIDALRAQYIMRSVPAYEFMPKFTRFQLTDLEKPYWWQPVVTSQTEQYIGRLSNDNIVAIGQQMIVLWDPQSQVMYAQSYNKSSRDGE